MSLLEVEHLTYSATTRNRWGFTRERRPVLRDICLTLQKGEIVGLLGPSGSGKTTLGLCLAGLRDHDGGSIRVHGRVMPPGRAGREAIQLVFQGNGTSLDPTMTAGDSIAEGILSGGRAGKPLSVAEEAKHLLGDVGLEPELLGRKPPQMSGGQKQRVALARALAARPEVLILDEPTAAQDVLTRARVYQLVSTLRERHGFAVLLISHDEKAVRTMLTRTVVLKEGMLAEGA